MSTRKLTPWAIVALILAFYGRTLRFGLVWDDYTALRHRGLLELASAWWGNWDNTGAWVNAPFYRPLGIAYFSGVFEVFGTNTVALHAFNLVLLFVAAMLVARVVTNETDSPTVGLVAALGLVMHPESPSSLAAWITQQFHVVQLIAILSAILVYQRVRTRSAPAWAWILVPTTLGVLVKEDALVVVPAVWIWQHARARFFGEERPPIGATVLFAVWGAAYVAIRFAAVGVGGYGTPPPVTLATNAVRAIGHTLFFLKILPREWIGSVAGIGTVVLLLLMARRWRGADPRLKSLAAGGLSLAVCGSGPLLLANGSTRVHVVMLGSIFIISAALAIVGATITAEKRRAAAAAMIVWIAFISAATWLHTNLYSPCDAWTRFTDGEVLYWDIVPESVKNDLRAKAQTCPTQPGE